jgi:hypothetical protein
MTNESKTAMAFCEMLYALWLIALAGNDTGAYALRRLRRNPLPSAQA